MNIELFIQLRFNIAHENSCTAYQKSVGRNYWALYFIHFLTYFSIFIKFIYSNYQTCKNCKYKGKCYTTNHKSITRYGHEVSYIVDRLMSTKDALLN